MVDLTVGLPWSTDEFTAKALNCEHLMDSLQGLQADVYDNVFETLTRGPAHMEAKRLATLAHYESFAKRQESDERRLHDAAPAHGKPILGDKKLLLFRTMLRDAQWRDESLTHHMLTGFRVTGALPASNKLQPLWRPATCSVEELMKKSR